LEALIEPLTRLAQRRLGGDAIAGLERLSAGATQEIWRFGVWRGETETPVILRRAPGGVRVAETAVGLATEAALMEAAARAGVPVPEVLHVLGEDDGLGQGFVMAFVEGETLGGRIARGEALAGVRPRLARQCGEILARIHTIEPNDFPNLRRAAPAELVAGYKATYLAQDWPRPVFEMAFRWLEAHWPPCMAIFATAT
jgi:aminoglycoside phosphotransferase (APT) family kinase protein